MLDNSNREPQKRLSGAWQYAGEVVELARQFRLYYHITCPRGYTSKEWVNVIEATLHRTKIVCRLKGIEHRLYPGAS